MRTEQNIIVIGLKSIYKGLLPKQHIKYNTKKRWETLLYYIVQLNRSTRKLFTQKEQKLSNQNNDMENRKYHAVGTVPKSNLYIVKTETKWMRNYDTMGVFNGRALGNLLNF